MAKRITVSVPDELGEQIDKWKGEISPSAIFQSAMEEAIAKKEGFLKRIHQGEDMNAIIERLRQEKKEEENIYFEKGKEDGLDWAKAASYSELKYATEGCDMTEEGYTCQSVRYDKILGPYWNSQMTHDPLMRGADDDDFVNDEMEAWLNGWFEAVEQFWNEVSDKL